MAKQIINNQTGTADSLKVMADKCISNFNELYTAIVTKTSDLTNDGSDGIHSFISSGDTIAISSIDGLVSDLATLQSQITTISGDSASIQVSVDGILSTIATLSGNIDSLNASLITMNSTINTQNSQISTMQGDIAALYNIVNNL